VQAQLRQDLQQQQQMTCVVVHCEQSKMPHVQLVLLLMLLKL
jgi:hypothetical protein